MTNYPTDVAREVAAKRPDLATGDAIATVLTANPKMTVDEVIDCLDAATEDAAAEAAY